MVNKELYAKFIRDIDLVEIKLISVNSYLSKDPEKEKTYSITLKTKFPFKKNASEIFVFPTYKVYFEDEEGENSGIFNLKCEFFLHYRVSSADKYNDDLIKSFADNNAKFNSWSYFRELLSSMSMRMGIGSLIAPLLKPRPPEKPLRSKKQLS